MDGAKGRVQLGNVIARVRGGKVPLYPWRPKNSERCKACGSAIHQRDAHCSECGSLDHEAARCPGGV